jgi:hypothetical protein
MAENKGQFKKGNTIGQETRFKEGNTFSVKYKDEYCDRMLEYFKTSEEYPTFAEFAGDIIGVDKQTLANWKESHPRFRIAYDICLSIQEGRLVKGGVSGKYNAAFAKFIAVNCHGMSDKSENDSKLNITVKTTAEIDEESN